MGQRDTACQNAVIWQVSDQHSSNGADSDNLTRAYLESPVGRGLRQQMSRSRSLTPAGGARKAARAAAAAAMLLAGRGEASS